MNEVIMLLKHGRGNSVLTVIIFHLSFDIVEKMEQATILRMTF
jgi:hypothetical protein